MVLNAPVFVLITATAETGKAGKRGVLRGRERERGVELKGGVGRGGVALRDNGTVPGGGGGGRWGGKGEEEDGEEGGEWRERQREIPTHTHTHREKQKQRQRQTEKHTETETETDRPTKNETHREIQTGRQADRQTDRPTRRPTDRPTDRQTDGSLTPISSTILTSPSTAFCHSNNKGCSLKVCRQKEFDSLPPPEHLSTL